MCLPVANIIACIRRAGPYLAIELILPGGLLIALILWLARNRGAIKHRLAGLRTCAAAVSQLVAVLGPSTASTP